MRRRARPGEAVVFCGLSEALQHEAKRRRLLDSEQVMLRSLEGQTGFVEAIVSSEGRGQLVRVRTRQGQEVSVSPGLLRGMSCNGGGGGGGGSGGSGDIEIGERCRLRSLPGTFTLVSITSDALLLQNDCSTAPSCCLPFQAFRVEAASARALDEAGGAPRAAKLLAPPARQTTTALLRPYQFSAVNFFLAKRRAIGYLPPGTGKTLIGLSLFLRMLHDKTVPERLRPGELFVVISDANLVDEVWLKQAHQFGMLDLLCAVRSNRSVPEHIQCVVVSFQTFALQLEQAAGCLWGRRVRALFVDEAHRLCGDAVWTKATEQLAKHVPICIGVTGTIFTNQPAACATLCRALCLPDAACKREFWQQPRALVEACRHGFVFRLSENSSSMLPTRPKNPPWISVSFASSSHLAETGALIGPAVKALVELIGCPVQLAQQFHQVGHGVEARNTPRKLKLLYAPCAKYRSSKMDAVLDSVRKLLNGSFNERRHHKIFMSVFFLDSLLLVSEALKHAFGSARLHVFQYHGLMSEAAKKKDLQDFLDFDSDESSAAVLLTTVASGKLGINVTNNERSPTAHIEIEQAQLASERFQLQLRIDRPNNPFAVQLVVLEGVGTLAAQVVKRQQEQAQNHAHAGCSQLKQRFEAQAPLLVSLQR